MKIAVSINHEFSSLEALADFATKFREVFASISEAVAPIATITKSGPIGSGLKLAADTTVEPREVETVEVEATEAAETQPATPGTECGEPAKRKRRTKAEMEAARAAEAAAKVATPGPLTTAAAAVNAVVTAEVKQASASEPAGAAITRDDVRKAMGELMDFDDGEVAFGEIMRRFGAAKISLLADDKVSACHAAVRAKIAMLRTASTAGDDIAARM